LKRVAIIGADFVPSSLPPATRIRFFARYLPEFGWQPVVITTDPKYYDWSVDQENEKLLPESLEVIRTRALSSSWIRKVGIGDIGMRSLWYHWKALQKLCRESSIDLVFIPVPPSVPMVLGRLANLKFGIPYVIDYIDPWVSEYYWKVPKSERPPKWPLAYAMARILEPFAIKRVGHITGVSQGTTDGVVNRYSRLSVTDATEIPYGAEPSDFEYLRNHPRTNSIFDKRDGLFHLSYIGACIPGMHPTVRALFQAFRAGLSKEPELFSKVRFHFVGTSYAKDGANGRLAEIAAATDIEQFVDERTARVAYLESLQIMLDSDALFLVGSDEAHYTASKVFPCLLARKPLLALFHEESTVNGVLRNSKAASTVSYSQKEPPDSHIAEIHDSLRKMLVAGPLSITEADVSDTGFLSARMMTARLASAFDRALTRDHAAQPVKALSESLTK
jgi:hypothetical protein